jgi:hypothetical protein
MTGNTNFEYLGSMLGNAKASGLDLSDLIDIWYQNDKKDLHTLEDFDRAVNMATNNEQ